MFKISIFKDWFRKEGDLKKLETRENQQID